MSVTAKLTPFLKKIASECLYEIAFLKGTLPPNISIYLKSKIDTKNVLISFYLQDNLINNNKKKQSIDSESQQKINKKK